MKGVLAAVVLLTAGGVALAGDLVRFLPGEDLSASAPVVASVDGAAGRSGLSFVVEFTAPDGHEGPVVSKPGVFSLDVSGEAGNRTYTFTMFGDNRWCSSIETDFTRLVATSESEVGKPERLAGVCTYYYQTEQSRIGYMLSLYLNGELIGSQSASHFGPNQKPHEPVAFGAGVTVKDFALAARACPLAELFPNLSGAAAPGNWKDAATQAWKVAQKGVRFLANDRLVVAVSEKETAGNPILAGWNVATGDPLFGADGLAWELELVGKGGLPVRVRSSSRRIRSKAAFRDGGFVVTSVGDGFTVRHGVKIVGGRIERMLETEDTAGARLRGATFPKANLVKLPGADRLVEPIFSGVVMKDPTTCYQKRANYPEDNATMQFVGYYNDRQDGVYFAAEDPKAVTKAYSAEGVGGRLTLGYYQSAPRDAGKTGARRFVPSGRGVLELYRGEWFQAGQVYRRFLRTSAPWYAKELPRTDTPAWFMNNPFWIGGLDLRHALKSADWYFRQYFDVQTSFVTGAVMSPDGHGGFGPNYTAQPEVKACYEDLRQYGIHFVCYTNPRLWYAGPHAEKSNDYSATGKRWALKRENGEPYVERYGDSAEGDYVEPCPAVAPWREFLCRRTRRVAQETGVDGVYHDQLPCASPYLCYDPDHGHKVADPAAWLSLGNWKFCDYLMGELRREMPELVHTGEECSEPYVNRLDGFVTWRFGRTAHVPLFQSLYCPRIQFVARGCDDRHSGAYESFFPKYAEQLAFGEQIGWTNYRNLFYPSPRRGYQKKLAHCREALAKFLNSSEMDEPLRFAERPERFTCDWGQLEYLPVESDKVITSVWRHKDGRRLVMFLNTVNAPQEVKPAWDRGGSTFTVCRERADAPETRTSAPAAVWVAPLGFEFWFVGEGSAAEAATLTAKLRKTADCPWKDRGAVIVHKPTFGRKAENDAQNGKPVGAKDAAWAIRAYIPEYNMFDCVPYDPAMKRGWAGVVDGGLVHYGTVDFGAGATSLELNLATDEKGVTVAFYDVTGDVPERLIAEFRPEAGDWHCYRPHVSPLFGEVRGKRAVVCRVTGGYCNLKDWKVRTDGTRAAARPVAPDAAGAVAYSNETPWTLFGRKTAAGYAVRDGGVLSLGHVPVVRGASKVELEIAAADPSARLALYDASEYAPSIPLATFAAAKGRLVGDLLFKVEGRRNWVLCVTGGACTVKTWKVK